MKCEECQHKSHGRRKKCISCGRMLCRWCFGGLNNDGPDHDWPICWHCMKRKPPPRIRVFDRFHDAIIWSQGLRVVGRKIRAGSVREKWCHRTGRRGVDVEYVDRTYHGGGYE